MSDVALEGWPHYDLIHVFRKFDPRRLGFCSELLLGLACAHGIRQGVQQLAAMRHERIGFVTGPLRLRSAMARKAKQRSNSRRTSQPPTAKE